MVMSNREMGLCVEVMSSLRETGRLGYAIARNTRKMRDCAKEYLEARDDALRRIAERKKAEGGDAEGDARIRRDELDRELEDIAGITHDCEIFTVSPDDFASGSLNSAQMELLLWMVKED